LFAAATGYGAAITIQAMKEAQRLKEIVNKYHEIIRARNFRRSGISLPLYITRTTAPIHLKLRRIFTYLNDKGDLEQKKQISLRRRRPIILADRYIVGTCRFAEITMLRSVASCCGSSLSLKMLINPAYLKRKYACKTHYSLVFAFK